MRCPQITFLVLAHGVAADQYGLRRSQCLWPNFWSRMGGLYAHGPVGIQIAKRR
jgi:hypothetical protein